MTNTTVARKTPKMTAGQARTFTTYSGQNAAIVRTSLQCECEPYKDVFTYNRWQAQGMQVRRGEKSIRIPVMAERTTEDEDGNEKFYRIKTTAPVFCRCQVDPKGMPSGNAGAGSQPASTPSAFGNDCEICGLFIERGYMKNHLSTHQPFDTTPKSGIAYNAGVPAPATPAKVGMHIEDKTDPIAPTHAARPRGEINFDPNLSPEKREKLEAEIARAIAWHLPKKSKAQMWNGVRVHGSKNKLGGWSASGKVGSKEDYDNTDMIVNGQRVASSNYDKYITIEEAMVGADDNLSVYLSQVAA